MELYTSRWANRELAHLDVVPVGISRGVPRWPLPYRYKLLRFLAPNRKTFGLQNHRVFEAAYVAGLEEIGVEKIAAALERISREKGGRPLVMLCYEKDPRECHRGIFSRWWQEQTRQEVPELRPGVVPLRSDASAQETLF